MKLPALLTLSLLLCACTTYPTPRPFSPALAMGQAAQATPAPDYLATAAVAQAAAEYAVAQTATAEAQANATATAQMGATVQAVTLQWAQVAAQQTQSAMTVTAQAVQAAQATGTYQAGAATQTATAAIPAMTATRAAQVVDEERESFSAWAWLAAALVAFVATIGGAVFAGVRWADAQGAERKARAAAQLREAEARAYSLEMAAMAQATKIQIAGRMMLVIVSGQITAAHRLPAPEEEARLIEQPPTVPGGNRGMVEFIRAAQAAAGVTVATFIPSDEKMGVGGSKWAAYVDALKAMGLAVSNGTGRPANGDARTKLADGWSLKRLLEELENGQVIVPAATEENRQ